MVLAGLIIAVCVASLFVIIGRQWLNKRRGLDSYPLGAPRSPYNDSPAFPSQTPRQWQDFRAPPGVPDFPTEPPPRYESALEDEGQAGSHRHSRPLSMPWSMPRHGSKESSNSRARELGSSQTPRELL
jgi:hypothetical protein